MDVALIVLLPFLGACIPPLTARSGRNVCAGATAAVTFAALLLLLARAPAVFSGETVVWGVPWVPQIGLSFSFFIDALGLFFAALILGICSLLVCGPICGPLAIVYGNKAKSEINASNGSLGGAGLATAGVVLGWIGVAFAVIGILFVIAAIAGSS